MVKHVWYDRKQVTGKYTHADGGEVCHTIKPDAWDTDSNDEAMTKFAGFSQGQQMCEE